jgi:hypothetical protein
MRTRFFMLLVSPAEDENPSALLLILIDKGPLAVLLGKADDVLTRRGCD